MPKHFFECIYAGMSGDTGGFRYSNVTTRSMEYGAEVISHGIDHAEINRIIFDSRTLGEIKAQKLTFEKMELLCDGALAVIMFTNEMKDEISIGDSLQEPRRKRYTLRYSDRLQRARPWCAVQSQGPHRKRCRPFRTCR